MNSEDERERESEWQNSRQQKHGPESIGELVDTRFHAQRESTNRVDVEVEDGL